MKKEIKYNKNSIKYLFVMMGYNFLKVSFVIAILKYILYEIEKLTFCINLDVIKNLNESINYILIPSIMIFLVFFTLSELKFYMKSVFHIDENKINIDVIKLLTKNHYSFKYVNLQHIELNQNIIERIFNLKTIIAHTSSGESSNLKIKNIDKDFADEYFLFLENEILKRVD